MDIFGLNFRKDVLQSPKESVFIFRNRYDIIDCKY